MSVCGRFALDGSTYGWALNRARPDAFSHGLGTTGGARVPWVQTPGSSVPLHLEYCIAGSLRLFATLILKKYSLYFIIQFFAIVHAPLTLNSSSISTIIHNFILIHITIIFYLHYSIFIWKIQFASHNFKKYIIYFLLFPIFLFMFPSFFSFHFPFFFSFLPPLPSLFLLVTYTFFPSFSSFVSLSLSRCGQGGVRRPMQGGSRQGMAGGVVRGSRVNAR
jgi:hypothetical protein